MTRETSSHQTNWDWRAATNFVGGGSGAGLLCVAGGQGGGNPLQTIIALVLIAGGLTAVWFEIGRPWRALNVFLHPSSSWMSRESIVAVALFFVAALSIASDLRFGNLAPLTVVLSITAGLIALGYLYAQARILYAAKGIPAWREPVLIPFMIVTGVVEGGGILFVLAPMAATSVSILALVAFAGLVAVRAFFWVIYLRKLGRANAPRSTLSVLRGISPLFLWGGHLVPILLVGASLGMGLRTPLFDGLVALSGVIALAAGWAAKYAIVARAAFNQGFALPNLPDRGSHKPLPSRQETGNATTR